jgi:hypothetical protein
MSTLNSLSVMTESYRMIKDFLKEDPEKVKVKLKGVEEGHQEEGHQEEGQQEDGEQEEGEQGSKPIVPRPFFKQPNKDRIPGPPKIPDVRFGHTSQKY